MKQNTRAKGKISQGRRYLLASTLGRFLPVPVANRVDDEEPQTHIPHPSTRTCEVTVRYLRHKGGLFLFDPWIHNTYRKKSLNYPGPWHIRPGSESFQPQTGSDSSAAAYLEYNCLLRQANSTIDPFGLTNSWEIIISSHR